MWANPSKRSSGLQRQIQQVALKFQVVGTQFADRASSGFQQMPVSHVRFAFSHASASPTQACGSAKWSAFG